MTLHRSSNAIMIVLVAAAALLLPWAASGQRRPEIVSRKQWNAKKPVGEAKEHKIQFITIHHTATKQRADLSLEKKLQNLQAFSQRHDKLSSGKFKPAWFDVPYHYYISVDGRIGEGRELKYVGDTNTEYDPTGHALIVLEGSFDSEEPTKMQIDSLKRMVAWLARRYRVPADRLKGHSDYAKTGCPGENLRKLFGELRREIK